MRARRRVLPGGAAGPRLSATLLPASLASSVPRDLFDVHRQWALMEIGEPQRELTIEPLEDPVPRETPAPDVEPAEVPEEVPA